MPLKSLFTLCNDNSICIPSKVARDGLKRTQCVRTQKDNVSHEKSIETEIENNCYSQIVRCRKNKITNAEVHATLMQWLQFWYFKWVRNRSSMQKRDKHIASTRASSETEIATVVTRAKCLSNNRKCAAFKRSVLRDMLLEYTMYRSLYLASCGSLENGAKRVWYMADCIWFMASCWNP